MTWAQGLRTFRDWVVVLARASRLYSGGQVKVMVVLIVRTSEVQTRGGLEEVNMPGFQVRKELKRPTVSTRLILAGPCARREACPFRDPADRLMAHSEEHVVSACADMIDKQA